ncbi:MAG TPA: hypothetical protein VGV12_10620 [Gemmatimonadales bacterium]|nr:hypothetical protein [Gemmatimonadales bacterium]
MTGIQKYVLKHVPGLPDTPLVDGLVFIITVVVIVSGAYRNSVFWRNFNERQQAKTAALLGGSPDRLRKVLEDVERLLLEDPLAAQRMLQAYSQPLRDRSQVEREDLWQRARADRSAAHELEQELRDDLAAYRHTVERLRGVRAAGPGAAALLSELEGQIDTTQRDLSRIDAFHLKRGNENGAA